MNLTRPALSDYHLYSLGVLIVSVSVIYNQLCDDYTLAYVLQ
jgi:hypothetical protein